MAVANKSSPFTSATHVLKVVQGTWFARRTSDGAAVTPDLGKFDAGYVALATGLAGVAGDGLNRGAWRKHLCEVLLGVKLETEFYRIPDRAMEQVQAMPLSGHRQAWGTRVRKLVTSKAVAFGKQAAFHDPRGAITHHVVPAKFRHNVVHYAVSDCVGTHFVLDARHVTNPCALRLCYVRVLLALRGGAAADGGPQEGCLVVNRTSVNLKALRLLDRHAARFEAFHTVRIALVEDAYDPLPTGLLDETNCVLQLGKGSYRGFASPRKNHRFRLLWAQAAHAGGKRGEGGCDRTLEEIDGWYAKVCFALLKRQGSIDDVRRVLGRGACEQPQDVLDMLAELTPGNMHRVRSVLSTSKFKVDKTRVVVHALDGLDDPGRRMLLALALLMRRKDQVLEFRNLHAFPELTSLFPEQQWLLFRPPASTALAQAPKLGKRVLEALGTDDPTDALLRATMAELAPGERTRALRQLVKTDPVQAGQLGLDWREVLYYAMDHNMHSEFAHQLVFDTALLTTDPWFSQTKNLSLLASLLAKTWPLPTIKVLAAVPVRFRTIWWKVMGNEARRGAFKVMLGRGPTAARVLDSLKDLAITETLLQENFNRDEQSRLALHVTPQNLPHFEALCERVVSPIMAKAVQRCKDQILDEEVDDLIASAQGSSTDAARKNRLHRSTLRKFKRF